MTVGMRSGTDAVDHPKPSTPGICTSRKTRSGRVAAGSPSTACGRRRTRRRLRRPPPAAAATATRSRASGSSSTTSGRISVMPRSPWHRPRTAGSAMRIVISGITMRDREPAARRCLELESVRDRRRGARAATRVFAGRRRVCNASSLLRRQPDAVIPDLQRSRSPFVARDRRRRGRRRPRADPVPIAFSTSGCSSRLGTAASSVSGSMSKLTCRRSPNRVCSISRYFSQEVELVLQRDLLRARRDRA